MIYLRAGGVSHIIGKFSTRLQLCFKHHCNWRFVQKIMGLQSCKSSNFKNFRTPNMGVLKQNDIWVQPSWLGIENTIRGKVMASPKSKPWWVLWICVCAHGLSVHQECYNYALTNLLFGLWRFMWIVDLFVIHISIHPKALARPSYPQNAMSKGAHPNFFFFYCFHFQTCIWILWKVWGCVNFCWLHLSPSSPSQNIGPY
jgi:hypothetical protein